MLIKNPEGPNSIGKHNNVQPRQKKIMVTTKLCVETNIKSCNQNPTRESRAKLYFAHSEVRSHR